MFEVVWERLEGMLPAANRKGRPYAHARREIVEAIVYVMERGGGWRELPEEYPPWQTVYWQWSQWKKNGLWERLWNGLSEPRT
jgi:transposase